MAKEILFDTEARDGLKRGVDALANAVKVTLGPKGRFVTIGKSVGLPQTTKDGVTVAKEVHLKNAIEDMGAQMVKEVASKTGDLAGDGTTTATVLAQALVREGLKNVAAGANPMDLKKGFDKAVAAVVAHLETQSEKIDNSSDKIMHIASISANNDDEIGKLIADAFKKVGRTGIITVEEAKGTDTYVDVVEGLKIDRGFNSAYFVTNQEKNIAELENPYILIYDGRISTMKDLIPVLEPIAQQGRSLLIIADDVDGEALSTLVANKLRGALKVAAIKAPDFNDRKREIMEDIAVLTEATVISAQKGLSLENFTATLLGNAKKVIVGQDDTVIVNGYGEKAAIEQRQKEIAGQLENAKSDFDKERHTERLAKLSGGVAVLFVGAPSEVEMKEKKDRVDDALAATRAAAEEGIVAGGGVALIRAKKSLDDLIGDTPDEALGIKIIARALEAPLRTIVENDGMEGSVVVAKVIEGNDDFGYNAKTDRYEPLKAAGVIDPKKVTRVALENAASVAGMILTTECAMFEERVDLSQPFTPGMVQ